MTAFLSEHVRSGTIAVAHKLRGLPTRRRLLIGETALAVLLVTFAVGGDYVLAYVVFNDFLGPLPGEDGSASVAVIALSTLVAMSAYALYRKANPDALPVRIVERCAGGAALLFVFGMGLMIARTIYSSVGDALADGAALFGEPNVTAALSLFDRFFNLASTVFALCVGGLVLAQVYIVDRAANHVRGNIWEIARLGPLALDVAQWTRIFEEIPRTRDALLAEREALQRKLEVPAAFEFANELAMLVHGAIAPVVAWIKAQELIKAPAGALIPFEPPSVDVAALKKQVAPLVSLEAKTVYAAFQSDEKEKKK